MQIHNNFSPNQVGHGGRPDHAGNGHSRAPQFQPATAETEPATTTDTTTAVTPTEEIEGPRIPGNSVAHRARAQLAQLSGLLTSEGQNFGWLVSQIARDLFHPAAYTTDGEGTDGTDGVDVVTTSDETGPTGETGEPAGDTAPVIVAEDPAPVADDTTDPVVDLVDTLLEESEDDTEVT